MNGSLQVLLRAALAVQLTLLVAATKVRAEDMPARYLGTLSSGAGLRLSRNVDLGQSTLAPAFIDVLAGHVWPGGRLQSGAALGASMSYTDDGEFVEPVIAFEQIVLMPAYVLRYEAGADFLFLAHAGLPFELAGPSGGFELAAALGYRLLAGFGLLAELGMDAFLGLETSLHPTVSLELGVFVDYEVLP